MIAAWFLWLWFLLCSVPNLPSLWPCLCCPRMQSAVGAAAWAPGPRWRTHTVGALSSEKPPSTQVNPLSLSQPCLILVAFVCVIYLSCSATFFILLIIVIVTVTCYCFLLSSLWLPLLFLSSTVSLLHPAHQSPLLFPCSFFPRVLLSLSLLSDLSLSIMASNYPEMHSFWLRKSF